MTFRALEPLVLDSFKDCEGLARIAIFDAARGSGAKLTMLGKVVQTVLDTRCVQIRNTASRIGSVTNI